MTVKTIARVTIQVDGEGERDGGYDIPRLVDTLDTFHITPYRSSKFQHAIDELVYEHTLDGFSQGDGDSEMPVVGASGLAWGYTDYVEYPDGISRTDYDRLRKENPNDDWDVPYDRAFCRAVRGATVNSTSSGAVYVTYYASEADFDAAKRCIEAAYRKLYRTQCTQCGNTLEGRGEVLDEQDEANGVGCAGEARWRNYDEPVCRACALTDWATGWDNGAGLRDERDTA